MPQYFPLSGAGVQPVGAWLLNDSAASTTVVDYGSAGNDGTAQANTNTLTTSGPFGSNSGLTFNGSTDYVDLGLGLTSALLDGSSAVTATAWIKVDTLDATDQIILAVGIGFGNYLGVYLSILGTTDLLRMAGRSVKTESLESVSSTDVTPTGEWIHVAGVLDYTGDAVYLYKNGVLNNSAAVTFDNAVYTDANDQDVNDAIGASFTPARNFDGSLSDVRIYDVALSAGQIYAMYLAGRRRAGRR